MLCKHCGNQIAEDSKFCAYCGKSLEMENTLLSNSSSKISLNMSENEVTEIDNCTNNDNILFDESKDWTELDANKDYNVDELNLYIKMGVKKLNNMASDFTKIERFSHYNELMAVLTPCGISGSIRENAQQKKLKKYLEKKIYHNRTYDNLGFFMLGAAENLVTAQERIQKKVAKSNPIYWNNVRIIIDALLKYNNEWKDIAPEVYAEELTLKDGTTFQLGFQLEYEMHKELMRMEFPKGEYNQIKKNVKNIGNGMGCMTLIAISFIGTMLASCVIL